jgi:heme/copper-type cytochrome/quinol oxidase subunit 2
VGELRNQVLIDAEERKSSTDGITVFVVMLSVLIVIVILGLLIFLYQRRNKNKGIEKL